MGITKSLEVKKKKICIYEYYSNKLKKRREGQDIQQFSHPFQVALAYSSARASLAWFQSLTSSAKQEPIVIIS